MAVTGHIRIVCCEQCGFVFNAAFDSTCVVYDVNYENDQTRSPAFHSHMDAMADRVLGMLPNAGGSVVEVGCGQGAFLTLLDSRAKMHGVRLALRGFDPAYRGGKVPEGVEIAVRFLDENAIIANGKPADVIVARHVIEHIPDPVGFLKQIHKAIGARANARLVLETPCFSWIAKNGVIQDVFYEHVNYFTSDTLSGALMQAGFGSCKVSHVFGGQYLWAEAVSDKYTAPEAVRHRSEEAKHVASNYGRQVVSEVERWQKLLADGRPTAVWGGGAKGVTFINLVDPECSLIACVVDMNPRKQNAWIASTAHPIVSPKDAQALGVSRILVMNNNYTNEIQAYIASQNWDAAVIEAGKSAR